MSRFFALIAFQEGNSTNGKFFRTKRLPVSEPAPGDQQTAPGDLCSEPTHDGAREGKL